MTKYICSKTSTSDFEHMHFHSKIAIEKFACVNDMANAFDNVTQAQTASFDCSHCFAASLTSSAKFVKDICRPFTRATFIFRRRLVSHSHEQGNSSQKLPR